VRCARRLIHRCVFGRLPAAQKAEALRRKLDSLHFDTVVAAVAAALDPKPQTPNPKTENLKPKP